MQSVATHSKYFSATHKLEAVVCFIRLILREATCQEDLATSLDP